MTPTISPSPTLMDTPSTATTPPKRRIGRGACGPRCCLEQLDGEVGETQSYDFRAKKLV